MQHFPLFNPTGGALNPEIHTIFESGFFVSHKLSKTLATKVQCNETKCRNLATPGQRQMSGFYFLLVCIAL